MGFKYGKSSLAKRANVHPKLLAVFDKVLETMDHTILNGGRTLAQQQDYFNGTNFTGVNPEKKKLSQTMASKHLIQPDGYAHAMDVAPYPMDWNNPKYTSQLYYFAGFVKGVAQSMGVKLRFGGDFSRDNDVTDENFLDLDHFELEEG